MKKYILIILGIITISLLGIWVYMTSEGNTYNEKYEIEKVEEHSSEAEIVEIENLEEKNKNSELIPELEDLSVSDYAFYSLVDGCFYDLEQKKVDNISYGDFSMDISTNEGFTVIDEYYGSVNACHVYNDKENVSGTIYYTDKDYTEENLTELFSNYKSDDAAKMSILDLYEFGKIQEVSFCGYEGVYNRSEYSIVSREGTLPVEYRYIAYFNCDGKILAVYLTTYKNCSFGLLNFEELLNKAIKF